MKDKEWVRADEFMAELEKDPAYRERRSKRAEKFRRLREHYAELDKPILATLRSQGLDADSLEDVVNKFAPLPEKAVSVLIENLEKCADERQCEALVRALGAAANSFDGRSLVRCYERTSDESLRWAIANTIALAKPHSIDEWIKNAPNHFKKTLTDLGYYG